MQFTLKKAGTVTECREALNDAIAALPLPESQENKVIRMAAHYVVADGLDPKHDVWQAQVQAVRATNARAKAEAEKSGGPYVPQADPVEPSASVAIDVAISFS